MKIVVCIKQVPDTTEVTLNYETNTLVRTGIPVIINPDDKSAIEAALELKENMDDCRVTVISMGPPQAKHALREALAMGCDDAVLISDRKFGGSDTLATSTILSAAIKKIGFDIVMAGRQAIDGDTAQVGPQIAEHLGIPQVSYVENIEHEGKSAIVTRQFEDRYHKLRVNYPCLFTIIQDLGDVRYMTVSGITASMEKEIALFDYETLKDLLDPATIGLKGSPTNVVRSFIKEAKSQGTVLKDISAEQAVDAIMERLHEEHLI